MPAVSGADRCGLQGARLRMVNADSATGERGRGGHRIGEPQITQIGANQVELVLGEGEHIAAGHVGRVQNDVRAAVAPGTLDRDQVPIGPMSKNVLVEVVVQNVDARIKKLERIGQCPRNQRVHYIAEEKILLEVVQPVDTGQREIRGCDAAARDRRDDVDLAGERHPAGRARHLGGCERAQGAVGQRGGSRSAAREAHDHRGLIDGLGRLLIEGGVTVAGALVDSDEFRGAHGRRAGGDEKQCGADADTDQWCLHDSP